MKQAVALSAPHTHDESSVQRIMLTVVLAITPATAVGLWVFGWPAVHLLMVTSLSAVAFEALALWLRGRDPAAFVGDGSALLAGWLLALTLPPWAPWWIGVVGSGLAILVGKHAFGGLGQNVFNPAMFARVALLLSFPVEMTTWPEPLSLTAARLDPLAATAVTFGSTIPDGISGATLLGQTDPVFSLRSFLLGSRGGSFGETSALFVGMGALLLLLRGVISWHVPLGVLLGILVPSAAISSISPETARDALFHLTSGGILFTAFFIATDPATSPSSAMGKFVFGAGVGLFVFVIRDLCSLPEGAAFAVLLMNATVPLIDRKLKPRVYGRTRSGRPLPVEGAR